MAKILKNNSLHFINKPMRLFIVLSGLFICNALLAEFLGVKIFSLEKSLGFSSLNWSFFGVENLSFNLTAGVVLWPVVFIMTDIINEYFGKKGVRIISFLTAGLILYAFGMAYWAIQLSPADFWPQSHILPSLSTAEQKLLAEQVGDYNEAYKLVFGQGMWIIMGSLIAFLIGQFVDVFVFQQIKKYTGEKGIWARATGSTLISQFIDSFVVLFVAFYFGAGWDIKLVLAIGTMNYIYKFVVAILITPIIYLVHYWIDGYLGETLAAKMKWEATHA